MRAVVIVDYLRLDRLEVQVVHVELPLIAILLLLVARVVASVLL